MRWLKRLLHKSGAERELDRELQFHLDQQIAANRAAGMEPNEARRQALLTLGGLERVKQEVRDAHWESHLESLLLDFRYALRSLRHDPRFALTAILALALGIGANTALFSIVNAVLLRPLPYPHPEQLVTLRESKPNFATGSVSFPNFLDWRKENRTFSSMAIFRGGRTLTLTGLGDAEQVNAMLLSSGFFEQLAVIPTLGRTFTDEEERVGDTPTVMLAAALWTRKYAASPDVLGKSLTLDGKDFTIIGVVPASFDFLGAFRSIDIYQPIGQWDNTALLSRSAGLGISGVGRLKPGVTIDQARADMQRVAQNLAAAYPDADKNINAALIPFRQWNLGSVQSYLFILLGAVGFVLLIACVNVANLLLARSVNRAHEFAIRSALGAGQSRIVRQLLVESVLIAAAGGGAGLLLAAFGTQAVLRTVPTTLPRAEEISTDTRVFLFAAALSLICGIFFGIVPALKTAQRDPQQTLQEGGRGGSGQRHRLQRALVAAEISLALVLLIGAGLMIRTLAALHNVDPGFDADKVLTFGLSLPPSMMKANPDAVRATLRHVQQKFEGAPGVQAVAYSWGALPLGFDDEWLFWIAGHPKPATKNEMNWALDYVVGPDYFKALGIRLQSGRLFTEHDDEHAPQVAVIDEVLARRFFPGVNPVGQRMFLNNDDQTTEIIGVVSYIVSQRTREIGIRVALGAQQTDILGFVLRQAAKMAVIGVLLGLVVSAVVTRLLSALLFHVTPTDPLTLAGVVSLLLTVTLLACYIPARRAASIDPLVAIRYE
jgi:predicted permease